MLEPDWNPAVDLQAMGRVWRQGQTKPVFIYRLATHGTLEEKILQRQVRKQALSTVMVNSDASMGMQSGSDLKALKQVYALDGYSPDGVPLHSAKPFSGTLSPSSGVLSVAVQHALYSARILSTTETEAPMDCTDDRGVGGF
ncbi:unnamed protein product [Polarella glacialis]|uniref:Helicase C-terminal domain-containing protein n=1 Tax=Polarella glacialis TaxID=89957 RepID=A0A813E858_POLGL|nr:unnamed protein product [Polarella glacialis]